MGNVAQPWQGTVWFPAELPEELCIGKTSSSCSILGWETLNFLVKAVELLLRVSALKGDAWSRGDGRPGACPRVWGCWGSGKAASDPAGLQPWGWGLEGGE